jgi:hypothetical protein
MTALITRPNSGAALEGFASMSICPNKPFAMSHPLNSLRQVIATCRNYEQAAKPRGDYVQSTDTTQAALSDSGWKLSAGCHCVRRCSVAASSSPQYLVSEGLRWMVALRKALTAGSTEVTRLDADAARILIEGFVPPSALVTLSVLDHIDTHMRHFIETSPLCFISSADADGVQEVSPRGDPQGSFKVLNERTLAIAIIGLIRSRTCLLTLNWA